jgi:hypothetical protein
MESLAIAGRDDCRGEVLQRRVLCTVTQDEDEGVIRGEHVRV